MANLSYSANGSFEAIILMPPTPGHGRMQPITQKIDCTSALDPNLPVANVSFMASFPLLFREQGIDVQREFVTV
jgi:hypothetical protein